MIPIEEEYFRFFTENSVAWQDLSRLDRFLHLMTPFYQKGFRYFQLIDTDQDRSFLYHLIPVVKKTFPELKLVVGGSISSVQDAAVLLANGADQVVIGSHFRKHPEMIADCQKKLASRVVVSLDYHKAEHDQFFAYLKKTKQMGCNHYLLVDADRILSLSGINPSLIAQVRNFLKVNDFLIYSGGVSSMSDFALALQNGADCTMIGSAFYSKRIELTEYATFISHLSS
ncbi:MAG: HisA/HisF-related TIM barrel protein [Patescibacteria group bacterium]